MADRSMEFYKTIGARIRDIRIEKGLSQADLAVKADLSLPVISAVENARSKVWLITFAKIAEALEVSADDILRLSTPPSTASYPDEFNELLKDCTAGEIEAILKISKQVKSTFDRQKKELS